MRVRSAQFCRSSGGQYRATVGGRSYCVVLIAERRDVMSMARNGTVGPGGRTTSGVLAGDAAHVLDCGTLRKAGTLSPGVRFRALGNLPRPESWLPYVFISPQEAAELGVCKLSAVSWYGKR